MAHAQTQKHATHGQKPASEDAMIPQTVDTTLTITRMQSDRTWHAQLPNGRAVLAFRPTESAPLILEPGSQVAARLTVCDFSRALILTGDEASTRPQA